MSSAEYSASMKSCVLQFFFLSKYSFSSCFETLALILVRCLNRSGILYCNISDCNDNERLFKFHLGEATG